jgi:hypothetical protein
MDDDRGRTVEAGFDLRVLGEKAGQQSAAAKVVVMADAVVGTYAARNEDDAGRGGHRERGRIRAPLSPSSP